MRMKVLVPASPPSLATTSKPPPLLLVHLGPKAYLAVQCALVVLRLTCVAFFVFAAWLYHEVPQTNFSYSLSAYGLVLDLKYFPHLRHLHLVLAIAFALTLLLPLCHWVVPRLGPQRRKIAPHDGNQVARLSKHIKKRMESGYERLYGRRGLCGIESPYFDLIFLVREIVELTLQTTQAAQISRLLSRPWYNRFYVGVLVANCWLTPLLHHAFRHHEALQRLSCVICDVALDFISVVWTPVYLFRLYYRDFDLKALDFPASLWYNDRWEINLLQETQLIFLSSWSDVFSRVFFSISLLGSIRSIQRLVAPYKASLTQEVGFCATQMSTSRLSTAAKRVMLPIMALWGLAVLTAHLHASRLSSQSSCDVPVYPWLVSKHACSLMIVNCYDEQIRGYRDELAQILSLVDETSLAHIVFRHCPQLQMPAILRRFPTLIGLKMFNCTVDEWTQDAALSTSAHPRIRFLYLIRVKFHDGVLPDGMTDTEFPQTLVDVEMCATNLKELPSDLHDKWPSGGYIYVEASELDQFPPTLLKLPFLALSLAGNKIPSIPPAIFEDPGVYFMLFRGNPITNIPEDLVYGTGRYLWVYFEYTNVSIVPTWMQNPLVTEEIYVQAGHSPLCEDISSDRKEEPWLDMLICNSNLQRESMTIYPLQQETARSALAV